MKLFSSVYLPQFCVVYGISSQAAEFLSVFYLNSLCFLKTYVILFQCQKKYIAANDLCFMLITHYIFGISLQE